MAVEASATNPVHSCFLLCHRQKEIERKKERKEEEPTWQPPFRPLCRLSQHFFTQESLVARLSFSSWCHTTS